MLPKCSLKISGAFQKISRVSPRFRSCRSILPLSTDGKGDVPRRPPSLLLSARGERRRGRSPLRASARLELLHFLGHLRDGLEQIGDQSVVADVEDGSVSVLVD